MLLSTTIAARRAVGSPILFPCSYRNLPRHVRIPPINSCWNAHRTASTALPPPSTGGSQARISVIFSVLIAVGVASTAYGLYDFYNTLTMWPQEVRKDLRAGLKARNQGDLQLSERYLTRALDTASKLPLEQLSPDPHLKVSGIAIVLASVLEDQHKLKRAYDTYVAAFERLKSATGLTGSDKARAGAIAYKLGQLAESRDMQKEERSWYEAACKELLGAAGVPEKRGEGDKPVDLTELSLPTWVGKFQIVEPLRALANCYTRDGDHQLALTTLLLAVPLILGQSPRDAPTENLCIGADLMNTVAETLLEGPPTPEARQQAEHAVSQAIELIEVRRKRAATEIQGEVDYCELVMAAALFNWGALREMDEDLTRAKQLYQRSRKQSLDLKEHEGVIQAETALRRVDRLINKADSKSTTTQS
ncbi:hypothetical protein BDY19DRAFT_955422 [Irpex rosettiformis]|uniref:Uncharacterized protein n=1 Tax=Irpex rosettiformis TaxID=378272 RepID=A0ACB8TZ56_9APHY|nr:hypothetical protein BDY19DRAFT_955422 [Irpex rosettiformis]